MGWLKRNKKGNPEIDRSRLKKATADALAWAETKELSSRDRAVVKRWLETRGDVQHGWIDDWVPQASYVWRWARGMAWARIRKLWEHVSRHPKDYRARARLQECINGCYEKGLRTKLGPVFQRRRTAMQRARFRLLQLMHGPRGGNPVIGGSE